MLLTLLLLALSPGTGHAFFADRPGQLAQQADFVNPFVTPRAPQPPRESPREGGWQRDERGWQTRDPGWGGRDAARDAVQRGDILPLEQVVASVQARHPGRVLDARLDTARPVYHLRLLATGGQVLRIAADARNGAILSVQGAP